MTKRKLRKNADINPPQSPHDGIHTCSKGCKKPGCNRTLRDTIEELKAQVERLSQPAIIGGYNLSQYIRMANSETLEFDNGDIFADMTLPERIKYIVESHARLKADVDRLTAENASVKLGNAELRQMVIERGETAVEDIRVICRLEAEVERLTKAGDELERVITSHMSSYEAGNASFQWRAAKEGKQSK
jgi:regulator of replication initiation timing